MLLVHSLSLGKLLRLVDVDLLYVVLRVLCNGVELLRDVLSVQLLLQQRIKGLLVPTVDLRGAVVLVRKVG